MSNMCSIVFQYNYNTVYHKTFKGKTLPDFVVYSPNVKIFPT